MTRRGVPHFVIYTLSAACKWVRLRMCCLYFYPTTDTSVHLVTVLIIYPINTRYQGTWYGLCVCGDKLLRDRETKYQVRGSNRKVRKASGMAT